MSELAQKKRDLRTHYRKIRRAISLTRREEAKKDLVDYLDLHLRSYKQVLSFFNLEEEVDLSLLNKKLLEEKRLLLNRLEGDDLISYKVESFDHLDKSRWEGVLEPNPKDALKVERVDCILVPGVVFDEGGNRIGFGYGYYDRLIARYPEAMTIGIAFREQLSQELIPHEEHDKPVKELCLV